MDKKTFCLTARSVSLRTLFVIVLVTAVLLSPLLDKKSRSMDSDKVQTSVDKSVETEAEPALSIKRSNNKLNAATILASNYSPPAHSITTETIARKAELPPLSPPNITRGNILGTKISVTFDGGMGSRQAIEILDILKKRKIKTTIFLSGNFIRANPEITKRILADGHEVGNHTTDHPHLTQLEINGTQKTLPHVTKAFLLGELNRTDRRFFEVTGQHMSPLWRAPYGEINSELRAWAFSAGYLHIGWTYDARSGRSLDSLDWVADKDSRLYHGPRAIEKKILDFDKKGGGLGGGIILMHLDTDRGTDRAAGVLGEILDNLLERGFSLVKVSDLIVNQRLLREAKVKKDRLYKGLKFSRQRPSRRRFKIHVRAKAARG